MIQKEVTAQVPEKKNAEGEIVQVLLGPVTVLVDFPESFEEALSWCTEEAMLSNGWANFKVSPIQAGIRNMLKAGGSQESIQEALGKTVMGVARTGGKVDVKASFVAQFKMATPEGQAELLTMLRDAAEE